MEKAIATVFLPALLQEEVSPIERKLYGLPVRNGGMGVLDPTTTARRAYTTSKEATTYLVKAIKEEPQVVHFEVAAHWLTIKKAWAE